jgi:hypothetical protein
MGRDPEADGLQALRRDGGSGDSPLNEQQRTVQKLGSSLYVNLTGYVRDTHGISKGDKLSVATYSDGIWIGFDDE